MTPFAPLGTKVVIHYKPINLASWGPNGKEGWYIGPALNHYRFVNFYISTTRAEVNADTMVIFNGFLTQAAEDIITVLKNPLA